jgi:hypothetical protein
VTEVVIVLLCIFFERRFRLAISKAFVQLLGGEMASQEGIGSAFYFSLPLAVKIKESHEQNSKHEKKEIVPKRKKIKNADCR